ncbi:GPI ethanolamine phosphate transferase 3 isoform X1 [Danaus plexippus]|uniref:GPI ethanolamine phosphate transferase 3 isoform X1 n=2 Tax=Danaus plexippus TaxID=13037 RepID=UPI002AB1BF95|nr:GPI ethanolamine phosphate transferase 3 isoform X1 [Danaus plexippus]
MKEKWNFILYLVWFSYLLLSAVLMFGQGFLLSRKTLNDVSQCVHLNNFGCDGLENSTLSSKCSEDEKIQKILSLTSSPLICSPKRNRVAFILVDALRYDFTEYDENKEKPLFYHNQLPIIQKIVKKWPKRSRIFRFMADPPTTTLQRLKALITGSLPTFIDMSSNFGAIEIQEDNIIDQVVSSSSKAILLGDDTWERLLPGRWTRSHSMYSFHTWDLDTVDNEVDSKIYDEIKKSDWDLLIAHYLGVDHAGHRYGPNHPEMARKLMETNTRLEKLIEILPSDVILYVAGDHGMTETGDHGGESKAERTAALFAYYGSGFSGEESDRMSGREIQQTDLAPTISAALGRPPPAPSLGNLLLPLLPNTPVTHALLHLTNNLKQVTQYLLRYGEESQQVPLERLAHLINATRNQIEKAADVKNDMELRAYVDDVRQLMDNLRGVFREVWVEFDSLSMLRALLLLLLAIFFNWLIIEGIPFERISNVFSSSFVPSVLVAFGVCVGICYTTYYYQIIDDLGHAIVLTTGLVSGALTCMLVIMHWDGITQRWYEGRSLFYERFGRAALFASAIILVSNSYIIEEGATLSFLTLTILGLMAWNVGTVKAMLLWAGFGAVMALTRTYRGCREEQGECWTSGEGMYTGSATRAALVLALGSVSGVVATARRHLGWRGYGIVIAGIFTCAHWAVGWGSLGSPSRSKMLARGAWLVIVTMFVILWKRDGRGTLLPLVVSGLLFYLANALVLGAAYAPTAGLALLSGFLALNVVSMLKSEGAAKFSLATRCSSSMVCLWALLASYHFYGTGHHATLGHVRWTAVFHAGDPNYLSIGHVVSVVLMFIYLFGMPLMFGATVPLLGLWGRAGSVGPRTQLAAVFTLCLKFQLCFAIRIFACALSATIHCRHLMVWGVFTPKLLFEFGSCVAALIGSLIGATLTAWHIPCQTRTS